MIQDGWFSKSEAHLSDGYQNVVGSCLLRLELFSRSVPPLLRFEAR
jgi:hypothetical protein